MADDRARSDILTAVAIVTLVFMVGGIALAVVQLHAYAQPSRTSSIQPKEDTEPLPLAGGAPAAGGEAGGEAGGLGGDDAGGLGGEVGGGPPVPPPPGDDLDDTTGGGPAVP